MAQGSPPRVLVVCTANRGRSPIGEALLRRKLAERGLGEAIVVQSAGMSTTELGRAGQAPGPKIQQLAEAHGLDISAHRATPFDPARFDDFALVVVMESWQELALLEVFPRPQRKVFTMRQLAGRSGDPTTQDVVGMPMSGLEAYFREADACFDEALESGPLADLIATVRGDAAAVAPAVAAASPGQGPLVVTFDAADEPALDLLGGKCLNLARMTASGLPVPGGFAVTTRLFDEFLVRSQLAGDIAAALAAEPEAAAAAIAELFAGTQLDEEVREPILAAYRRMAAPGKPAPRVAVRSSATTEDIEGASGAGQQLTLLGVTGEEALIDAVRQCWASLFSAHAILYRKQHGLAQGAIPTIAVGVQLLVDAAVAGVMFTVDPITGADDRLVVEASWGLGEALVSGEVTPDRYLISRRDGTLAGQRIASKDVEVLPGGDGHCVPVPAERREVACLQAADFQKLFLLARSAEAALGPRLDIEWAIDGQGKLHMLQARPVTTAAPPPPPPSAHKLFAKWTA